MEELTTEQVAQILDLQQGTVRIRLHRARLSVRKEMSKLLSGAADDSGKTSARAKKPRAPDQETSVPMSAAICLPTSRNTLTGEWSP